MLKVIEQAGNNRPSINAEDGLSFPWNLLRTGQVGGDG